jgi:hypothetical protein
VVVDVQAGEYGMREGTNAVVDDALHHHHRGRLHTSVFMPLAIPKHSEAIQDALSSCSLLPQTTAYPLRIHDAHS